MTTVSAPTSASATAARTALRMMLLLGGRSRTHLERGGAALGYGSRYEAESVVRTKTLWRGASTVTVRSAPELTRPSKELSPSPSWFQNQSWKAVLAGRPWI